MTEEHTPRLEGGLPHFGVTSYLVPGMCPKFRDSQQSNLLTPSPSQIPNITSPSLIQDQEPQISPPPMPKKEPKKARPPPRELSTRKCTIVTKPYPKIPPKTRLVRVLAAKLSGEFVLRSHKVAMRDKNRLKWIASQESEIRTFRDKKVTRIADLPAGLEPIPTMWVFAFKPGELGELEFDENRDVEGQKSRILLMGVNRVIMIGIGIKLLQRTCPLFTSA